MPIIEIVVLIQVGGSIGVAKTLLIIVATAVLGTIMLRQQGLATLSKVQHRLAAGELPAEQLMEGILLLIGGVLLLTPGFVTDAIGFVCLVPYTRALVAKAVARRSSMAMWSGMPPGGSTQGGSTQGQQYQKNSSTFDSPGTQTGGQPAGRTGNRSNDVIEGSFSREDD